jgi:hypothetical protein
LQHQISIVAAQQRAYKCCIEIAGIPFSPESGAAIRKRSSTMDSPALFLVSTVIWSFAISLAALLGLMLLDWLEVRRRRDSGSSQIDARVDSALLLKRLQQPVPPRRRQAAAKQVAVKAA